MFHPSSIGSTFLLLTLDAKSWRNSRNRAEIGGSRDIEFSGKEEEKREIPWIFQNINCFFRFMCTEISFTLD